jgi:extradiol dioxygenase family protein
MRQPVLHLSIPVHDLGAARRFYETVLGCRVGRVRSDWLDVWFFGMQLTLQERPDEVRPPAEQGVRHFGIGLVDRSAFDALVERLATRDVTWLSDPTTATDAELSGKTAAKVADPSGNVIEIKCYPDGEAYRTGSPGE